MTSWLWLGERDALAVRERNLPFLDLNGRRFTASEAVSTRAVMGLAAENLEEGAYAAFPRESSRRP